VLERPEMPDVAQIAKFIDRTRACRDDDALIRSLPWQFTSAAKNDEIRVLGETPRSAFVLLDGWAARYSLRHDGSRRITGFILPGDTCWLHAALGMAMDHAVTAITECNFATIPASDCYSAVRSSPTLNIVLWKAKLVEDAILRVWLRSSESARLSLAHLLCELHVRLCSAGLSARGTFEIPATQQQLADALGLTIEHLNRTLRSLREDGFILTQSRMITIVDVGALQRFCAFKPSYLGVAS
jgi:CRP-like cAMP-binding protein